MASIRFENTRLTVDTYTDAKPKAKVIVAHIKSQLHQSENKCLKFGKLACWRLGNCSRTKFISTVKLVSPV